MDAARLPGCRAGGYHQMAMLMDVQRQVDYWRTGAAEDFAAAHDLLDKRHFRLALFMVHLSIEKILKAHVCQVTGDYAPRTHSLIRLVELAKLGLSEGELDFMATLDRYNMAGRYPDPTAPNPTENEAATVCRHAEEMLKCLQQRLSK